MADTLLKEFTRLQKATRSLPSSGKAVANAKESSLVSSLDSLLTSLRECKHGIEAGATSGEAVAVLAQTVEESKKEVDERQKEVYNALARFGKSLDKVRSVRRDYPVLCHIELPHITSRIGDFLCQCFFTSSSRPHSRPSFYSHRTFRRCRYVHCGMPEGGLRA